MEVCTHITCKAVYGTLGRILYSVALCTTIGCGKLDVGITGEEGGRCNLNLCTVIHSNCLNCRSIYRTQRNINLVNTVLRCTCRKQINRGVVTYGNIQIAKFRIAAGEQASSCYGVHILCVVYQERVKLVAFGIVGYIVLDCCRKGST